MADFERGLLISDLPPTGALTPETIIEVELEEKSYRCNISQLLELLGDELVTKEELESQTGWATNEW